jgi:hypothetical protein
MNEFKVGDEVVINLLTGGYSGKLKVGSVATIGKFSTKTSFVKMVGELNIMCCWHNLANIKHAEKWSIYNNTLPWSQLSDKQKGKLLLAAHAKIRFTCNKLDVFGDVAFNNKGGIYNAQYIELVKPEPTMEELFLIDWKDCLCVGGKQEQKMIAKGWTKPCK